MNISYRKLWVFLAARELNKTILQNMAGISSASMAKLGKNENVNTDTLVRICSALKCDFSDIMEMTETDDWQEIHTQNLFQDEPLGQFLQNCPMASFRFSTSGPMILMRQPVRLIEKIFAQMNPAVSFVRM